MQIAKYFATFGIKVDPKSLEKVNAILKKLETATKNYHKKITALDDNTNKKKILGLTKVEKATKASQNRILRDTRKHNAELIKENNKVYRVRPVSPPSSGYGSRRVTGSAANLHNAHTQEYQYRIKNPTPPTFMQRVMGGFGVGAGLPQGGNRRYGIAKSVARRTAFGVASAGTSRGLLAAIPMGAAIMGVSRKSLEASNAYYSVEAVVKSQGGTEADAKRVWDNMKNYSQEYGMDFGSLIQPSAQIISGMMAQGKNADAGFELFKSLSGFTTSQHTDTINTAQMFRGFRDAIGKGTLQAEEWKRSIGDAVPAALPALVKGVVAEAVANKNLDTTGWQYSDMQTYFQEQSQAGAIRTLDVLPYIQKELDKISSKGLEVAKYGLQASQNRAFNDAFFAFDPTTDFGKQNIEEMKLMWGGLGKVMKDAVPALIKFTQVMADSLIPLLERAASLIGVDINERSNLRGAATNAITGKTISLSEDIKASQSGWMGKLKWSLPWYSTYALVTGEVGLTEASRRERDLKKFLEYEAKYNDFKLNEEWRTIRERDAFFESDRWKNIELPRRMKEFETSNSASSTIVKPKSDSGLSMTNPQASAGSVFNGDIYVTTDDAKSFNSDLLRTVSQFNGIEKTGVV